MKGVVFPINTRQQDIINLLEKCGEMSMKSLEEHFKVSMMTIHRDLNYLEEEGYIFKKRGAAAFVNAPDRNKTMFYAKEKHLIGKAVKEFIRPGQSIIFDNSTTALEAAKHLHGIPGLTFYTTSLAAASIVCDYPDTVMYCSGGCYFNASNGFIGSIAEDFVKKVNADIGIIGASGISLEHGLTNPYSVHSTLQKLIIKASKFTILAADHSKFDKVSMEKAADLSEIDLLITDSGIDENTLENLKKHINIKIAEED